MKVAQNAFYHFTRPFIILYMKIVFNIHMVHNPFKGVKGPYLVLGHHVKNEDPLMVMMATGRVVRFLAGDANMTTLWKKLLFRFMGMVPFKKRKSDMKSIRQLMSLVKDNEAVGLYPEGGRNWDGKTDTIIPSTAKLIKMLGVDVYVTFYKGGYLTKPRWADYSRKGIIEFSGYRLFKGTETKVMKTDEIMEKLVAALDYNEYDWQREHQIPFRGQNRASGITRLLYKCPNCNAEHQLETHGNSFSCKACGQSYFVNTYGFIEGAGSLDDTVKWHEWQKSFIPGIAASPFHFEMDRIHYEFTDSTSGQRSVHKSSHLLITPEAIVITTEDHTVELAYDDMFGFSITLRDLFEFYTRYGKHRLILDPKRHLSNVFLLDFMTQLKETGNNE